MGRDNNIYGNDDNTFAESCAADALTPVSGVNGTNQSDYWGDTIDQDAMAKGGSGDTWNPDTKILRKVLAGNDESEPLDASTKGGNRHRRAKGSF